MTGQASDAERFWEKVDKGDVTGCWLWMASREPRLGYGHFKVNRRLVGAHRVAYELAVGPIPPGLSLMHFCDNPPCVNPAHLTPGTIADNNRDKVAKGRNRTIGRPGSKHPLAKLTEETVRQLRAESAAGTSYTQLAARYGIDFTAIGKIVRRERWAHV